MADTASPLLRVRQQEDGKADWGGNDGINEVIEGLENGARGRNAISLTGNLTLDGTNFEDHTDHYRYAALVFSDGGLSSQPTVTAPDIAVFWYIKNTGSTYDITFKCSGTGVTIPQGRWVVVFSDGTDCELYDPVALATTATAASASEAATSASNASTSETNASTSASNASTSETNAATSETNAETSATNAATSETNAAASAAGVNLPALVANEFLQANSGGTAYESKSASEVATAIGALTDSDTGTTANKIVKLDGSAKLPAVDGSQLTNMSSFETVQSKATISSDATVDFTLVSADENVFYFQSVIPATDSVSFYIRMSSNSGSTFDVTVTGTRSGYYSDNLNGANHSSSFYACYGVGSASTETGIVGVLTISQMSGKYATGHMTGGFVSDAGKEQTITAAFRSQTTSAITDIRFEFSSGNLESGTIIHTTRSAS